MQADRVMVVKRGTAVKILERLVTPIASSHSNARLAERLAKLARSDTDTSCLECDVYLMKTMSLAKQEVSRGAVIHVQGDPPVVHRQDEGLAVVGIGRATKSVHPFHKDAIGIFIVRQLEEATEADPLTKVELFDMLLERYDMDADKMKRKLESYLVGRIKEAGLDIRRNPRGYWIVPARPRRKKYAVEDEEED
jgi:hypothetical protein